MIQASNPSNFNLGCWEQVVAYQVVDPVKGESDDVLVVPAFVVDDHKSSGSSQGSLNKKTIGGDANRTRKVSAVSRKDTSRKRNQTGDGGVDHMGIRMGACLLKMETSVDILLDRLLVGKINEIALGALVIGFLLGVMIINIDETAPQIIFDGRFSPVKMTPWLIRAAWLGILPSLLPDVVRALGAAGGAKEPMESSFAIAGSCLLVIPLWLVFCDLVFISILMDLAGDVIME